jgi:DNA-binding response OmpR family regulator
VPHQVDLLRQAGFWVVEAQDADKAFVSRARPDTKVVLTDAAVPGTLDGFEFARLVRQGWPEVGVLVVSGEMTPRPGDLPSRATFVAKPARPAMLARYLRRCRARSRGLQRRGRARPPAGRE